MLQDESKQLIGNSFMSDHECKRQAEAANRFTAFGHSQYGTWQAE